MGDLRVIASSKNWIDYKAVESLKNISNFDSVVKVVALPDLSVGTVPNGCAILSKRVYPHFIGGDIGCGMSLFCSTVVSKKIKVDRFTKRLTKIDTIESMDSLNLKYNLGTIGKGNHFAELQIIDKVINKEWFEKLGLCKDRLYILVHSGSRAYGQKVFNRYNNYNPKVGLDESEVKGYLREQNRAINFAKFSRETIAKRLFKALGLNSNLESICSQPHNSIEVDDSGLFLHRKGAVPTSRGVAIIAGSRGSLNYLVMPKRESKEANYSISHGAGRKWERNKAYKKLKSEYRKESFSVSEIGSKVVCKDARLLYEEAPKAYKNIDIVIADLVDAGLIEVVATFRPILTYKE